MLKEKKKIIKRKKIAKSTCELFMKKGFVNISISEIAKTAGIGKGTVYEYFKNKEDIVFALMSCLQEEYDPKLEETLKKSETTQQKIEALFSLYLSEEPIVASQQAIYKEFLAITLNNPSDEIIQYQNEMMEKYSNILDQIIQTAIQKGEFKKEASYFIPSIFATMDGFFIARKSKKSMREYLENLLVFLKQED